MASYNNKSWIQNSTYCILIIISFLMLQSHNVNSAYFSFSNFVSTPNSSITFQGDAFASNGFLYLTKLENGFPAPYSAGRASYSAPLHLWDSKTGKLASFFTSFTFILAPNSPNTNLLGDGIAFFIAPFFSSMPKNSSGGYLGLFSPETALNSYKNNIVAVEFDSFSGNSWDPNTTHIGIDVNSIASVTTEKWVVGNGDNEFLAYANVGYDSVGKNFSVSVKYPGSSVNASTLSFGIDLRTVLPEWVRIGFSGATGSLVERHRILDWTFSSSF